MIRQAQVDDTVRVSKLMRTIITVPEVTPIQKITSKYGPKANADRGRVR